MFGPVIWSGFVGGAAISWTSSGVVGKVGVTASMRSEVADVVVGATGLWCTLLKHTPASVGPTTSMSPTRTGEESAIILTMMPGARATFFQEYNHKHTHEDHFTIISFIYYCILRLDSHENQLTRTAYEMFISFLRLQLLLCICAILGVLCRGSSEANTTDLGEVVAAEHEEYDVPIEYRRRRRLLERKTLSPESKATIRMANEMVLADAKEKGKFVSESSGHNLDPLQERMKETRKKENENHNENIESNNDGTPKKYESFPGGSKYLFNRFRGRANWNRLDPLEHLSLKDIESLPQMEHKPQLEYLGVMIDAGRHYFPILWLKKVIVYLSKMRYNMILFRLTDDENFIVKLDSYPQLAVSAATMMINDNMNTTATASDGNTNIDNKQKAPPTNKKKSSHEYPPLLYMPKDLKEVVAFAKKHGIMMVPEINLPFQATSWAGIPGLIVNCPNFICDVGHFTPVNVYHHDFSKILKAVLKEVLDIFDTPKMLHLGGAMSMHDADECFQEAGWITDDDIKPIVGGKREDSQQSSSSPLYTYWETFETTLQAVLKDISYPEQQVIRTQLLEEVPNMNEDPLDREAQEQVDMEQNMEEIVDDDEVASANNNALRVEKVPVRTGGIKQYWMSFPTPSNSRSDASMEKASDFKLSESLISTGLDFSSEHDANAVDIYRTTLKVMELPQKPKGIVVGAFVGTDFWMQLNVPARLIAISMGASHKGVVDSKKPFLAQETWAVYNTTCHSLMKGPSKTFCDLYGLPAINSNAYLQHYTTTGRAWRHAICNRLTNPDEVRVFRAIKPTRVAASASGNALFFRTFHRPPASSSEPDNQKKTEAAAPLHIAHEVGKLKQSAKIKKTGVIFDIANSLATPEKIQSLAQEYIAPLRIDLLQLRLVDDFAFAVEPKFHPRLALFGDQWPVRLSKFRPLVEMATTEWEMEVFPEISITTNAGGWMNSGYLVPCPIRYCKYGTAIPNDIREPQFLPVVYGVLRELKETFGSSSSYIHLGADERVENLKCYEESGLGKDEDPPFGVFEAKLKKILLMLGYKPENVIRWDNDEQLSYEDRVGGITHYRVPVDPEQMIPDIREEEPYFVTVSLLDGTAFSVYQRTRALVAVNAVGIMGELRSMDRSLLKTQHLGLRLIAFLLGNSSMKEMSQEQFVIEAIKICNAVQFKAYKDDPRCKAAEEFLKNEKASGGENGADDDAAADGMESKSSYPIAVEVHRKEMCDSYTRTVVRNTMKEEFVRVQEKANPAYSKYWSVCKVLNLYNNTAADRC